MKLKLYTIFATLIISAQSLLAQGPSYRNCLLRSLGDVSKENTPSKLDIREYNSKELRKLIDWKKNPEKHPESAMLVEQLIMLGPARRQAWLDRVKGDPSLQLRTKQLLQLLLYDQVAWEKYIRFLANRGDNYGLLTDSFFSVISKMPRDLASKLLKTSGELYPTSKKDVGSFRMFPPKRALDAVIMLLTQPYERISKLVDEGTSGWDAYVHYLESTRLATMVPGHGNYTPQTLGKIILETQAVLREKQALNPKRSWKMTLFGSLTSGRAKIDTSDIDVFVETPTVMESLPELTTRIKERMNKDHPTFNMPFAGKYLEEYSPEAAARVNPIQIEITPTQINLVVHQRILYKSADMAVGKPLRIPLEIP